MVEEKEEFEMGLPNGVGEQMLAHAFEKFDLKLEQTEFGPKLIGDYDELVKAREFLENAIRERLAELEAKLDAAADKAKEENVMLNLHNFFFF